MFGIEVLPAANSILQAAWNVQAALTLVACAGMVMRLFRRQRSLNA